MQNGMSNRRAALLGGAAVVIGLVSLLFFRPSGSQDAFHVSRFIWFSGGMLAIGVLILVLTAASALRNRRRGWRSVASPLCDSRFPERRAEAPVSIKADRPPATDALGRI